MLALPMKKHIHEPMYDYHEVIRYIEEKHGIDTGENGGRYLKQDGKVLKFDEEKPYLNFWHWIIDQNGGIHNGTSFFLVNPENYGIETEDGEYPENCDYVVKQEDQWALEILQMIFTDLGETEEHSIEMWVEW